MPDPVARAATAQIARAADSAGPFAQSAQAVPSRAQNTSSPGVHPGLLPDCLFCRSDHFATRNAATGAPVPSPSPRVRCWPVPPMPPCREPYVQEKDCRRARRWPVPRRLRVHLSRVRNTPPLRRGRPADPGTVPAPSPWHAAAADAQASAADTSDLNRSSIFTRRAAH